MSAQHQFTPCRVAWEAHGEHVKWEPRLAHRKRAHYCRLMAGHDGPHVCDLCDSELPAAPLPEEHDA